MSGKGDNRRPMIITIKEYDNRYDRIFSNKKKRKVKK